MLHGNNNKNDVDVYLLMWYYLNILSTEADFKTTVITWPILERKKHVSNLGIERVWQNTLSDILLWQKLNNGISG